MKTHSVVRFIGAALWLVVYPPADALAATADAPIFQAAHAELAEAALATHTTSLAYAALTPSLLDALHAALAQGQLPTAAATTPLDKRLHDMLWQLAQNAQNNIQVVRLPPLARIYHVRTLAALKILGTATVLGDLLAPSQALVEGLTRLQESDRDFIAAQAAAMVPEVPAVDPVWPGPLDEPVASIGHLVHLMGQPPAPIAMPIQAALHMEPKGTVQVQVRWQKPGAAGGGPQRLALARLGDEIDAQDLGHGGQEVATVDVRAGHFAEVLSADAWQNPPRYAVTAVNAFGVHSHPHSVVARLVGPHLAPPTALTAEALAPSYDDSRFYRYFDAVAVRWRESVSDVTTPWHTDLHEEAPQKVVRYAIYRLSPQDVAGVWGNDPHGSASSAIGRYVGEQPAGTSCFIDRPTLAELAQGVSYVVTAIGANGDVGRPRGLPGPNAHVRTDVRPALAMAGVGAAKGGHPLGWEVRRAVDLVDPERQAVAQAHFLAQPKSQQQLLWRSFWQQASVATRQDFWQQGTRLQSEAQRAAARQHLYSNLSAAGIRAAQLALYIEAHQEVLVAIQQHWQLLDEAGRRQAHKAEKDDFPPVAPRGSLLPTVPHSAFAPIRQLLVERPEHVAAWWHSRDAAQIAAIASWWARFDGDTQKEMLRGWLSAIPDAVIDNLAWPLWDHLTPSEQAAWLQHPPADVPAKLWPRFLAHVAFEALPLAERLAAVREDVGVRQVLMAQVRYFLRPLDLRLEFQLTMALWVLGLGVLSGYLLRYAADCKQTPSV